MVTDIQLACSMWVKKRRDGRLEGRVKIDGGPDILLTQPRKSLEAVQKDVRNVVIELLDESLEELAVPD